MLICLLKMLCLSNPKNTSTDCIIKPDEFFSGDNSAFSQRDLVIASEEVFAVITAFSCKSKDREFQYIMSNSES